MLRRIDLKPAATPDECAIALTSLWEDGAVFHLRGLRPEADLRDHYGEMMSLAGEPARLAEDATIGDRDHQRTEQIWMEVRYDPSVPNAYRHSDQPQPLHTDGSYIPTFPNAGLLACVSQASEGGETIFLDGRALLRIAAQKVPQLLKRLQTLPVPHARSGDRRTEPILREEGGTVLLNWNYYCVDPAADNDVLGLREDFFNFLAQESEIDTATVAVRLAPGEALIWKDNRVLHGRSSFKPRSVSERFFWKAAFNVQRARHSNLTLE